VPVDPATGIDICAGYWPGEAGWHQLQQGDESWPYHVSDSEEAAEIRCTELQDATLPLAQQSVPSNRTLPTAGPTRRGSPWPWFFAWLLAAAALWWLERTRPGRALSQGSNR